MNHVTVIRPPPRYEPGLLRASGAALGIDWPGLVRPGDRVVLKPNFIRQSHARRAVEWEQIITHGTVIAAVAAAGGKITLADAPQTDSDFDKICERAGIAKLGVEVLDLRREAWRTENGVIAERRKLPARHRQAALR